MGAAASIIVMQMQRSHNPPTFPWHWARTRLPNDALQSRYATGGRPDTSAALTLARSWAVESLRAGWQSMSKYASSSALPTTRSNSRHSQQQ